MTREVICIVCPLGCRMVLELEGKEVKTVRGNECKLGTKYAEKEVRFAGRILTTTVKTDSPGIPLLPVRSNEEISKDKLPMYMDEIATYRVRGPVDVGEPVIRNLLGFGVNMIACRSIPYSFRRGNVS